MEVGPSRTAILSYMGIGDVLMAPRAISYYRGEEGDIAWICKSDSSDVVSSCFIDSPLLVIDKSTAKPNLGGILRPLLLIPRIMNFLRQSGCKRAVILDYKWRPILVFGVACRCARVSTIIGCTEGIVLRWLLSRPLMMSSYQDIHEVDQYRDMYSNTLLQARPSNEIAAPLSISGLVREIQADLEPKRGIRNLFSWRPDRIVHSNGGITETSA